uniref:Large ribosomal subunit protein uL23m n=1 Tax=Bos indicus x Bos taurus TaxID=30522 RepID=A0A4W2IDY8_BOBOX
MPAGGGGVGAVDRVAAVERVTPGSQRALADRPSPPLVSLPPGRATGLSPGGWSPVTPTSLHPDASAGSAGPGPSPGTPGQLPPGVCTQQLRCPAGCFLLHPAQSPPLSLLPRMTRVDLRNYLERVYNVPVAAVRTRVQHGSNRRRDHRNVRIKQPDYKVAYVQLVSTQPRRAPGGRSPRPRLALGSDLHGAPGGAGVQFSWGGGGRAGSGELLGGQLRMC